MKNDWPTAIKFGFAVISIYAVAKCSDSTKEDPNADRSSMAYIQCKDFVKSRLKSPASAEFPSYSSATVYKPSPDMQQYTVTAYVDAQNSFGANLRSRFICEIEWNGAKSLDIANWKLNGLMLE